MIRIEITETSDDLPAQDYSPGAIVVVHPRRVILLRELDNDKFDERAVFNAINGYAGRKSRSPKKVKKSRTMPLLPAPGPSVVDAP